MCRFQVDGSSSPLSNSRKCRRAPNTTNRGLAVNFSWMPANASELLRVSNSNEMKFCPRPDIFVESVRDGKKRFQPLIIHYSCKAENSQGFAIMLKCSRPIRWQRQPVLEVTTTANRRKETGEGNGNMFEVVAPMSEHC